MSVNHPPGVQLLYASAAFGAGAGLGPGIDLWAPAPGGELPVANVTTKGTVVQSRRVMAGLFEGQGYLMPPSLLARHCEAEGNTTFPSKFFLEFP